MKVINAKLRGFIGIQKGLGIDEVEVDFDGISGLIALEGPNGIGKTTFLENLQPFRMLPSRAGTLKSHCFLKDSFKRLTFEFNGDVYRTMIKIDATTTRSDEGYIYKNGNQSSEVDSKVSNYDAYIEKLLGSPALFFSSIFCAQNSRKLSDLRPAELKSLFAEFLRLDRYVGWEETAKGAMKICYMGAEVLADQHKTAVTKAAMLGDPRADLISTKSLLEQTNRNIETIDSKQVGVKKVIEELVKQVIENKLNQERLGEQYKLWGKLKTKQEAIDNDYQSAEINRIMALEEMETELAKEQEILKHKEQIEAAVEDKLAAAKALTGVRALVDSLNERQKKQSDTKAELDKKINEVNNQLLVLSNDQVLRKLEVAQLAAHNELMDVSTEIVNIDNDKELVTKEAEITQMKKSASVLDDIAPSCPCPPEVCGLITASIQARDSLPDASAKLVDLKLEKLIVLQRLEAQKKAVAENAKISVADRKAIIKIATDNQVLKRAQLRDTHALSTELINETLNEIKAAGVQISDLNARIAKLTNISDRLPRLTAASDVSRRLIKDIAAFRMQMSLASDTYEESKAEVVKLIRETDVIIKSIVINEEAETQLANAELELKELTTQLKAEQKDQVRYAGLIPKCEKEIEILTDLEDTQKKIKDKQIWVHGQKQEWEYLRQACSKDGMRALEIGAVAPMISANANDLLTMTFGPNHSVRFETQDEDGKEVLSIIVISADGSETPLQFLSGGEKVWILKSLRLAQTLISQEKSGRHFQTALMDEEDGALSANNAMHFIELYRSFRSMADMDLCLYITHRPEAVALADNILRFKPGKVTIV